MKTTEDNLLVMRTMPTKLENFEIIDDLLFHGCGAFGTCKKIQRKEDGKILMWKEVNCRALTVTEKMALIADVQRLRTLHHAHILKCHNYIDDKVLGVMYIITEFCQHGNLVAVISKCRQNSEFLKETFIWKALYQLTLAVDECHKFSKKHSLNTIYHDIKPANVFVDSKWDMKLGNLGLVQLYDMDLSTVSGPHYVPPEKVGSPSCSRESDVWSLGCLIYELCSLIPPFTAGNWLQLANKIKNGCTQRIPSQYSEDLQNMIGSMLSVKGATRPTISKILHHSQRRKQKCTLKEIVFVSKNKEDGVHNLQEKEKEVKYREEQLNARSSQIERQERHLNFQMKQFEQQVKRAEKFMDEWRAANMQSKQGSRNESKTSCLTRSLDRKFIKDKKRVKFKVEQENSSDNKENQPTRSKIKSHYIDFEERRKEFEERLKSAQFKALHLREQEIHSRFFPNTTNQQA